jgi:hypothetical protein
MALPHGSSKAPGQAPPFRLFPFVLLALLLLPSCKAAPPDYDLYENMGAYMKGKLVASGATVRTDMPAKFAPGVPYIKNLGLLSLIFGSSELQVYLQSYESSRIAVGSISQFEAPPGSGNYTDCAFVLRSSANLGAPIMHGDARADMAGSGEKFSMDFYNYDSDTISLDEFFSPAQVAKLNQAMELVEQYQIPGPPAGNRGSLTKYLDPYKSSYRLDLAAPKNDETARKAYAEAALQAFKLYQDAYFEALAAAEADTETATVQGRVKATDAFINLFEANDTAVSLGRLLFGAEDFPLYFNKGFWREGYYGQGINNGAD